MHNTEIGIFKIAQTRVNWKETLEWLRFLGIEDSKLRDVVSSLGWSINLPGDEHQGGVDQVPVTGTDASALIAAAGKRCYMSFTTDLNPNVSKIRTDHAEYVTNILKSGHGSVLEHATWTFAIENISRVFTGEMNRHRAGVAVSEGSMRYIRFDDIGFTMPSSLVETEADRLQILEDDRNSWAGDREYEAKESTRNILQDAFTAAQKFYIDLCDIWKIEEMKDFTQKKKLTSMFRRIIGMGVSTGGVWTMNARALRHILAMRGSVHAEEEIYDVFDRIADVMIADEPLLFGDFVKNEEGSWVPKYQKV